MKASISIESESSEQLMGVVIGSAAPALPVGAAYPAAPVNRHVRVVGGAHLFSLPDGMLFDCPERSPLQAFAKRAVDVVGALVGLVLLSPLLVVVAVLVKLTSPGPALFVQTRAGRHGRPFRCFKFRTMRPNADAEKQQLMGRNELSGPAFKMTNDPRVTRFGRFLRTSSIDELPQLLNVVLGNMSLVGPRPPSMDELPHYKRHHWRRLSVTPGITGLWQVSGRSSINDFERWVSLDLQYIDTWSFALDVKLLCMTVPAVLLRKGAS